MPNAIKNIFLLVGKYLFSIVLFLVLLGNSVSLKSQDDFYNMEQVCEIRIEFYDANWKLILDSLFSAGDKSTRIKADVEIDGIVYKGCGIRYKGFSSWNSDEIKNPFSINLDYTYKNQNHLGYKKLKLSNVIYDPSFVREVLAYSIARKYMPAPQANYANLFINDTLIGLYTNVEAVDECFVEKHFSRNKNAFFKGNPESLVYPFGQNSNLTYCSDDSSEYFPYYSIESDYGWEQLSEFIYVLNRDTSNISKVLNVDRALWMHAFNYSLLNLDSYIAYAQNYYLFQDDNGQFNTILWDLNMSFGSFRHSDGATNFSGVNLTKLPILNPLQASTFTISPRPLMKNLFSNARYRKMYIAHIRTIMEQNIADTSFLHTAEIIQQQIADYVATDTNRFYSYEDFEQNIYSLTGGSTEQYPGIRDLMFERHAYLQTITGYSGYPVYNSNGFSSEKAVRNETLLASAAFASADKVFMFYRFSSDSLFKQIEMTRIDSEDYEFYAELVPQGLKFQYYFWAENDSAGVFYPEEAAYKFLELDVNPEFGDIVINEVFFSFYWDTYLASRVQAIELFNPNRECLKLNNYKLQYDGVSYLIPDTSISKGEFITLDISDISYINEYNTSMDENICLLWDNVQIDSLQISTVTSNHSFGRYPDGNWVNTVLNPTPSRSNQRSDNIINMLSVYPDPSDSFISIDFVGISDIKTISIIDTEGRKVVSICNPSGIYFSEAIDITSLRQGLYFIIIECENSLFNAKFTKI